MQIASTQVQIGTTALPPAAQEPPVSTRPGNSGKSVGHMAKQAVAAAREAGIELPANAQGLAASRIAKGADPASVFAALVVEEPAVPEEPATDPVDAEAGSDVPAEAETETARFDSDLSQEPLTTVSQQVTDQTAALTLIEQAATQYASANEVMPNGESSAQIALDLLS